jgi:hypothetical protein
MGVSVELIAREDKLIFDSGMDLILFLGGAFERKDLGKFFWSVSSDFKKDFNEFISKAEAISKDKEQINLYIHFRAKAEDSENKICLYDACWSRRMRKYSEITWQRDCGRAIIALKRCQSSQGCRLLLFDISGENPFN